MIKSTRTLLFFVLMGLLFVTTACNLQSSETGQEIVIPKDERLTESDFAILIGRKSGLITYLGPNGNIFTTNQAGRSTTSITTDANLDKVDDLNTAVEAIYYLLPTWSTSGRKLAFVQHRITNIKEQDFARSFQQISFQAQEQDQNRRTSIYTIYAADPDGSNQQELWSGTARPIYMYWAPDGRNLSALLQDPNASALQFALLSTDGESNGSDQFQLLDFGAPLYWDWAPHGKQILTHIGSIPSTERVSLLSLEAQVIEEILDIAPARFASPDISPNGQNVMLPLRSDVEDDDDTWVSIFDLNTRKRSVIEKLDGDLFIGGSFSPDSSMVAYIASETTAGPIEGELAIYTLATGDLKLSKAKNLIAFFWSPDSSKIAWFELINQDEGDDSNGRPKFGLHIFDVESQNIVELVKPFETTAQFNEVLTFYSQYQRSATIWSPDSRTVSLPVRTPEGPVIIAMDVSGEIHPRTLAPGVLSFWSAE